MLAWLTLEYLFVQKMSTTTFDSNKISGKKTTKSKISQLQLGSSVVVWVVGIYIQQFEDPASLALLICITGSNTE